MHESVRAVLSRLTGASVESDGALLARFAAERDEPAFAELVRRHGPMVLGVARRALGNGGDADDVFQATFLLLAVKCRSVPNADSLAGWLHGVARRTAANARKATARRTARERARATPTNTPSPVTAASLRELQAILDDELARLPEVYRAAFLLCHIEGHSRSEAAQRLGCSEGTVSSRVARAREQLQVAIRRRGLGLTAILTALAVADAACAAVSSELAASTLRVAGLLATNGSVAGAVSPAVVTLLRGGSGVKSVTVLVWVAVTTCVLAAVGFAQFGNGDESPPVPPQRPAAAQPVRKGSPVWMKRGE